MSDLLARVRVKAWVVLKRVLQRLGIPRNATLYYPSVWGWRYPAFMYAALRSREIFECHREDLPFFLQNGPRRDFVFRVRVVGSKPSAKAILAEPEDEAHGFDRVLRMHHSPYACHLVADAVNAPYFVHPSLRSAGILSEPETYRAQKRHFRVVFIGATGRAYERLDYPILNRQVILRAVMGMGRDVVVARTRAQIASLQPSPLVLALSGGTIDNAARPPLLTPREYIAFLGRSDFFLAAPGVVMPHCHNVIESMTLGVIPILNYACLFSPELVSGTNCLSFDTEEQLLTQVRRAVDMPPEEVLRMRGKVLDYYRQHLDPAAFGARLAQVSGRQVTIHVNAELGRAHTAQALWIESGNAGAKSSNIRSERAGR